MGKLTKREKSYASTPRRNILPHTALIDLLEMIDGEITKLKAARALLASSASSTSAPERRKPGRPAKREKRCRCRPNQRRNGI
jgi:hypothetical protein